MKFTGIQDKAIAEFKYVTKKDWTYKEIGKFWDSVHDYDQIDDETYAYKRRFYDSIKICSLSKKSKILDIDCRTGNGTLFYYRNKKISESTCISPSKTFLKVCSDRLKKNKVKFQTLLLKSLPLPLKDNSFDGVLCLETIEHIPPKDRVAFMRELNRLLVVGGELILSMPSLIWEPVHWFVAIFGIHHSEGPHRFLSKRQLLMILKRGGFKIKKEKTTVIIPVGPRFLTKFGEFLEEHLYHSIVSLIGLRRLYICKKQFNL